MMGKRNFDIDKVMSLVAADCQAKGKKLIGMDDPDRMYKGRIEMELRRWLAIAALFEMPVPEMTAGEAEQRDICAKSGFPSPSRFKGEINLNPEIPAAIDYYGDGRTEARPGQRMMD